MKKDVQSSVRQRLWRQRNLSRSDQFFWVTKWYQG